MLCGSFHVTWYNYETFDHIEDGQKCLAHFWVFNNFWPLKYQGTETACTSVCEYLLYNKNVYDRFLVKNVMHFFLFMSIYQWFMKIVTSFVQPSFP